MVFKVFSSIFPLSNMYGIMELNTNEDTIYNF